MAGAPNVTEFTQMAKDAEESLAKGILPKPPKPVGKIDTDSDEWVDIRTVDFGDVYTEEYGEEWKKDFPDDLRTWKDLDADNARQVSQLRADYKRERDGEVRRTSDELRLRGLVVSNVSSGLRLDEMRTQGDRWQATSLGATVREGGTREGQGPRAGGKAEAWAAEEERRERESNEREAAAELGLTDEQLEQYREWKKAGGAGAEGAGRAAGEEADVERMLIQATEGGDALEVIDHAHLISSHLADPVVLYRMRPRCIALHRISNALNSSHSVACTPSRVEARRLTWARGMHRWWTGSCPGHQI